ADRIERSAGALDRPQAPPPGRGGRPDAAGRRGGGCRRLLPDAGGELELLSARGGIERDRHHHLPRAVGTPEEADPEAASSTLHVILEACGPLVSGLPSRSARPRRKPYPAASPRRGKWTIGRLSGLAPGWRMCVDPAEELVGSWGGGMTSRGAGFGEVVSVTL